MKTFNRVNFTMKKTGCDQYYIESYYKGMNLKIHTTDSEVFYWLGNDSNKKKHLEAKRFCYYKIVLTYQKTQP